ncbi:macrophage mannose receptor 1-like [Saccoglossus kowalevskii]
MMLAVTNDENDYNRIVDMIKAQGQDKNSFWFGMRKIDGDVKTIYGNAGYQVFAPNEPSGNGDCIDLWEKHDFKYDDLGCGTKLMYVCEPLDCDIAAMLPKYKLITMKNPREESIQACESAGMVLARDECEISHAIMTFKIRSLGFYDMSFHIDAIKSGSNVVSNDGTILDYQPFAKGQPDGNGDCLYLWKSKGYQWDDDKCSTKMGYVCYDESAVSTPIFDNQYRIFTDKKKYREAAKSCMDQGMMLTDLRDENVHYTILEKMQQQGITNQNIWIGPRTVGSLLLTMSGSMATYQPFAKGEPNGDGPCVHLWNNYNGEKINDVSCNNAYMYICEVQDDAMKNMVGLLDSLDVNEQKVKWDESGPACANKGMQLAKDNSQVAHMSLLNKLLLEDVNKDMWIDVRKQGSDIISSDGQVQSYTAFHTGQPDGNGDCIHLWSAHKHQWDDDSCTRTKGYICEEGKTTICRKSKGYQWDDDKCSTKMGYVCYDESAVSTPIFDNQYRIFTDKKKYREAAKSCMDQGMMLTDLRDENVHYTILEKMQQQGITNQNIWIGPRTVGSLLLTMSGSMATYQPFAKGEPNGDGPCVHLW